MATKSVIIGRTLAALGIVLIIAGAGFVIGYLFGLFRTFPFEVRYAACAAILVGITIRRFGNSLAPGTLKHEILSSNFATATEGRYGPADNPSLEFCRCPECQQLFLSAVGEQVDDDDDDIFTILFCDPSDLSKTITSIHGPCPKCGAEWYAYSQTNPGTTLLGKLWQRLANYDRSERAYVLDQLWEEATPDEVRQTEWRWLLFSEK